MLRNSWLQWGRNNEEIAYKFFVDYPQNDSEKILVNKELSRFDDVALLPRDFARGHDLELYAIRGIFHVEWAVSRFNFDYYLRVDDDTFLCLHKLLHELDSAPRARFFWGKWWCNQSRARADENFMLFSQDIALVIASRILRVYPHTFAMNFAMWLNSFNLTLFDDRARQSAQTGIVAPFMHNTKIDPDDLANYANFCRDFIFAHHFTSEDIARVVYESTITEKSYPVPVREGPLITCENPHLRFFAPWIDMNSLLIDLPSNSNATTSRGIALDKQHT